MKELHEGGKMGSIDEETRRGNAHRLERVQEEIRISESSKTAEDIYRENVTIAGGQGPWAPQMYDNGPSGEKV